VIDAIKLCRYLGVSVEDIFGEEAGEPEAATAEGTGARPRAPWAVYYVPLGPYMGLGTLRQYADCRLVAANEVADPQSGGYVPILAPAAAGQPRIHSEAGLHSLEASRYVEFAIDDPRAFALHVDGESMSPDCRHGDLVIVSPRFGRQNRFADGILAIIVFGSERTSTLKILRWGRKNARNEPLDYLLEPINPAYPKMRISRSQIAAVYPVLAVVRARP